MKKLAVLAVAALVSASAFAAAHWVGNTYIVVNGAWYNGTASGNAEWPADLGESYVWNLGGEAQIYESDGQDGGVNWNGGAALLYYSIDNGDVKEIELPWVSFADNNNKMQNIAGINVADGLDVGEHSVTIYFGDNDHNLYSAADGSAVTDVNAAAKYTATFTKSVPEPATMSLLGLGALAMVIRRKLNK